LVPGNFQKGVAAFQSGDYATALREWTPLAEQGYASVQHNLGKIYDKGQGVPQDYKTAVKWYTLAAEQGYANAQFKLGLMYAQGTGIPVNGVYAYMWGNLGALNGNGGKLRDYLATQMTPADISTANKLARECVRKKYKGC